MLSIKKILLFPFVSGAGLLIGSLFVSSLNAADISVRKSLIVNSNIDKSGKYTFAQCNAVKDIREFNNKNKKKKAIIIGDSQACDFMNAVKENNYLKDYEIKMRYIPYRCQPVLGSNAVSLIDPQHRAFCAVKERVDNLEQARDHIAEAHVIVFSARWKPKAAKALSQTIRNLRLKPHQKVYVLGSKNFGKVSIRSYIHMSNNELRKLQNEIADGPREINEILRKGLGGSRVTFIDQLKLICGEGETCPVFTDSLKLISYDGRHLTKLGARYVGKILFQKTSLGRL